MKPTKQTLFGRGLGNCWPACLATILEIDIKKIPNFCAEHPHNWWNESLDWLETLGIGAVNIIYCHAGQPRGYWIATGKSPRGDFNHSVIYYRDKLFFDPHPDNAGLNGEPAECTILYPLTPNLLRQKPRRSLEEKVYEKPANKIHEKIANETKVHFLVYNKVQEKIHDQVAIKLWRAVEHIYDQVGQK